MDSKFQGFTWFLLACSLALAAQVLLFSPIESPEALIVPPPALLTPTNNHLQSVIKLGQGLLKGPEDIAVDKQAVLYTATRDGWIKRLHKNGTWENWKMLYLDSLQLINKELSLYVMLIRDCLRLGKMVCP